MASLSNHAAIPLQQRRRLQREDCQPLHRVRGRIGRFYPATYRRPDSGRRLDHAVLIACKEVVDKGG